jgi:hypothetical protein
MPMLEGEPHSRWNCSTSDPGLGRAGISPYEHSEIGATPLARYLASPNVRRDCPAPTVLADAFRIEVPRRQRRADGTVTLHGSASRSVALPRDGRGACATRAGT